MANQDKDSKLFVGLLVGGAVGIGALAIFLATRKDKAPLNTIGEAILKVGEILDSHHIEEPASMKLMDKKIHRHENTIGEVVDWLATGLHLWNKYKK